MANLKNITELPMAESADGLNLIVNDNGAAKQMPVSAVSVQADWNQNDSTKPDYVKNRPFYEAEDGEVHKIPEKYLPNSISGSSGGFDMVINFDPDDTFVHYGTFQNILDIYKSGRWPMIGCTISSTLSNNGNKDMWMLNNIYLATSVHHWYDDAIHIQCTKYKFDSLEYATFILYRDNSCELRWLD